MYGLIGVAIGLLINFLVIKPIEERRIRDECIRTGLTSDLTDGITTNKIGL